ncbi:MAG: GNAT family N-acetyltransferase [Nisaea sp.]|uniref:GNAT family N-acetyltransferase n=1 Tax=Nisaea sp. TaxID=2024842 RepID=UPI003298E2F7
MNRSATQEILSSDAFTGRHIDGAVRLSREASWPHRPEDWKLVHSVSTGVVALNGDDVVGTALRSDFGDVSTLSMIIVDARMRGRGLGRKLMAQMMDGTDARELRLVATADGLPLYEKLGFQAVGEILQHQGIAKAATPERAVEEVEAVDLEALTALDLAASGMDRGALLARIAGIGTVLRAESGFAMLRPFGRGQLVGPIVARDAATARALIAAAARRVEGQFLRIDMPMNVAEPQFAESLGLSHVGGGTAMVCGPKSRPTSEHKTFALAAQALG